MTTDAENFRRAYIWRPSADRRGGVTPPDQVEPAVIAIVRAWNERIPKNRVRILTHQRFIDCRHALATFTADEITAAIAHYSQQAWQRKKNAWKTFDAFTLTATLTQWVEAAVEAADNAASQSAAGRLDPLTGGIGRDLPTDTTTADFDRLPTDTKNAILREASDELRSLGDASPSGGAIHKQALVIFRRGRLE